MKMTKEKLNKIIVEHGKWLAGGRGEQANLAEANLTGADLSGADLSRADLYRANLSRANLSNAYLSRANLFGANLAGTVLVGTVLAGADLTSAYLSGAYLSGAELTGAKLDAIQLARLSIVPETGAFEGWKKVRTENGTAIVRLLIPADAPRSNANGRKCRSGWAVVLEGEGVSGYDEKTVYSPGLTVRAHAWCTDRWNECAGGIHFFLTRAEAEAYVL